MNPDISLWRHIRGEFVEQWYSARMTSWWTEMRIRDMGRPQCHICGKTERPTEEGLIALYDNGIFYECRYHGAPDRMTAVDCFTNIEIPLFPDRGAFIQGWWNAIDDTRYWAGSLWRFIRDAPVYWLQFWLRALSHYSRKWADNLGCGRYP